MIPFPITMNDGIDSHFLPTGSARGPMSNPKNVTATNLYKTTGHTGDITSSIFRPPSPATSFTVFFPKSPLRRIVARAPQFAEDTFNGTLRLTSYLETLECGHQLWSLHETLWDDSGHLVDTPQAKRRRCRECQALAVPKKSPHSVTGKSDSEEIA